MATATANPSQAPEEEAGRMSLSEHLGELRRRLMRVTLSVLVLGGASLVFARELYGLLMRPVLKALPPESNALVYTSAIEEINVYMKVGLYAGVFLTTPVILWQIWGFVSPGLYQNEKKLAGPFIIFGTLSFVVGALFCYFVLLDQMFTFLLREESAVILEDRMTAARLREEDARRLLRLGQVEKAGELSRTAAQAFHDGAPASSLTGDFGLTLVAKDSTEAKARLLSLGLMIDVLRDSQGPEISEKLQPALDKHLAAVEAMALKQAKQAIVLCDEGAALLANVLGDANVQNLTDVWTAERLLSQAQASYEAKNWTRPMLSMSEQLTLVLVLELAFGVIFELPLVMAVLGMVGLVKSSWLFKYQRHAFVVCLIAAALITPTGDAVNLALMAGPMLLCYELGVLLVWLVEKRRAKDAANTPPQP